MLFISTNLMSFSFLVTVLKERRSLAITCLQTKRTTLGRPMNREDFESHFSCSRFEFSKKAPERALQLLVTTPTWQIWLVTAKEKGLDRKGKTNPEQKRTHRLASLALWWIQEESTRFSLLPRREKQHWRIHSLIEQNSRSSSPPPEICSTEN